MSFCSDIIVMPTGDIVHEIFLCCKMMFQKGVSMAFFALSIFLSSFLLFQIQPMVGRFILPWFGGTPAVWSTLLLVYQVLLTGGYAYATWLVQRVKRPAFIHLGILLLTMIMLGVRSLAGSSPILPAVSASLQREDSPILEIIHLLLSSIA